MAQDASVKILRKINEAKKELSGKNVQGCLLHFKAALEIAIAEHILPADKQSVQDEIEKLQGEIQNSSHFKQIYGPVTFSGSEFDISLAFVKQLIQASAEELFESTELAQPEKIPEGSDDPASARDAVFLAAIDKINAGQLTEARQIIDEDEQVLDRIIETLNEDGIAHRSSGRYDEAMVCYSRGIELRPDEEGLHYNMARACFEKGDMAGALYHVEESMRINSNFAPGKEFSDFLKNKQGRSSGKPDASSDAAVRAAAANPAGKEKSKRPLMSLFGKRT